LTDEELRAKYAIPRVTAPTNGAHVTPKGIILLTAIFWLFFLANFIWSYGRLAGKWWLGG
jgi:hypothetical protein